MAVGLFTWTGCSGGGACVAGCLPNEQAIPTMSSIETKNSDGLNVFISILSLIGIWRTV